MPDYRFVFLDASGVVARSLNLPCVDDLDAYERARDLKKTAHLQVWAGARIVFRMRSDGTCEDEPD